MDGIPNWEDVGDSRVSTAVVGADWSSCQEPKMTRLDVVPNIVCNICGSFRGAL